MFSLSVYTWASGVSCIGYVFLYILYHRPVISRVFLNILVTLFLYYARLYSRIVQTGICGGFSASGIGAEYGQLCILQNTLYHKQ